MTKILNIKAFLKSNYFLEVIIILTLLGIILNPQLTKDSVIQTAGLWYFQFFSLMFVYFIFSELFAKSRPGYICAKIISYPFAHILKLNTYEKKIVFMNSILSGSPGVMGLISKFYDEGKLSKEEASYLTSITALINPLFFVSALTIFAGIQTALILYLAIVTANIILGSFCFPRIKYLKNNQNPEISLDTNDLLKSVERYLIILVNILGVMIVINLLISFIIHYQLLTFLPTDFSRFLLSLLEVIRGIHSIKELGNNPTTLLLITFLGSFLGVGIHLQIKLLGRKFIIYSDFLFYKFLHASLSLMLAYILLARFTDFFLINIGIITIMLIFIPFLVFYLRTKAK
ncbi:MAG: hypothetical protein FWE36_05215 [Erysipelotrichales bacterium]|nr:hypothetical protein [Erysipelotrichales bacterium]